MKTVRIHRHPQCPRCARYAAWHHRLDWLDRFEDTTQPPPSGPVRKGRIAIQDLRTGAYCDAADGFALLFSQIPAYWPLRPLPRLPWMRRRLRQELDPGALTLAGARR